MLYNSSGFFKCHYLISQHALELRKSAAIKLIKAHTVSYEINSILAKHDNVSA